MNLNHLSNSELLVYLDKHSTDPLIVRLVNILMEKQYGLVSDLLAAGMNEQTWTFSPDSYNEYYPGQYISHLHNELDYAKDELKDCEFQLQQAKKEIEDLKARTVAELIAELHQEVRTANFRTEEAEKWRRKAQQEVEATRDKMKVWRALTTDV
jgi:septal ring factor EnvC (AmiA/AmiB activator)